MNGKRHGRKRSRKSNSSSDDSSERSIVRSRTLLNSKKVNCKHCKDEMTRLQRQKSSNDEPFIICSYPDCAKPMKKGQYYYICLNDECNEMDDYILCRKHGETIAELQEQDDTNSNNDTNLNNESFEFDKKTSNSRYDLRSKSKWKENSQTNPHRNKNDENDSDVDINTNKKHEGKEKDQIENVETRMTIAAVSKYISTAIDSNSNTFDENICLNLLPMIASKSFEQLTYLTKFNNCSVEYHIIT